MESNVCRLREFLCAVRTVTVLQPYFTSATGTGRAQVEFAARTIIVASAYGRIALRAVVGQRFAEQKIEDEAGDEIGGHENQKQHGP